MDYKEKYEKALEIAKQQLYIAECNKDEGKVWYLKYMFPELRESEDERIRNFLIDYINARCWSDQFPYTQEQIISWLEKQGEKKGIITAQEAWKDMRFEVYAQASGNRHEANVSDDSTKMFSLNDIDEIFEKIGDTVVEQKPSWSEEDEEKPNSIIEVLGDNSLLVQWLNSIKERVQPQPKQEWSDVDEYQFNTILHHLDLKAEIYKKEGNNVEYDRWKELYNWLKSIKPQHHWKPSEEQMEALEDAISCRAMPWEQLRTLYNDLKNL